MLWILIYVVLIFKTVTCDHVPIPYYSQNDAPQSQQNTLKCPSLLNNKILSDLYQECMHNVKGEPVTTINDETRHTVLCHIYLSNFEAVCRELQSDPVVASLLRDKIQFDGLIKPSVEDTCKNLTLIPNTMHNADYLRRLVSEQMCRRICLDYGFNTEPLCVASYYLSQQIPAASSIQGSKQVNAVEVQQEQTKDQAAKKNNDVVQETAPNQQPPVENNKNGPPEQPSAVQEVAKEEQPKEEQQTAPVQEKKPDETNVVAQQPEKPAMEDTVLNPGLAQHDVEKPLPEKSVQKANEPKQVPVEDANKPVIASPQNNENVVAVPEQAKEDSVKEASKPKASEVEVTDTKQNVVPTPKKEVTPAKISEKQDDALAIPKKGKPEIIDEKNEDGFGKLFIQNTLKF